MTTIRRKTFGAVSLLLITTFVLALVTWILGIVTTVQITSSEKYPGLAAKAPSNALVYFYAAGMPMVVTIAAAVELGLYFSNILSPITSLIWSIISIGVWIWILIMWGTCERSADDASESCPKFYVYRGYLGDHWQEGVWIARLALGSVLAILAFVYLGLAARQIDVKRKQRKQGQNGLRKSFDSS